MLHLGYNQGGNVTSGTIYTNTDITITYPLSFSSTLFVNVAAYTSLTQIVTAVVVSYGVSSCKVSFKVADGSSRQIAGGKYMVVAK